MFKYLVHVVGSISVYADEATQWEKLCKWVLNTLFSERYADYLQMLKLTRRNLFLEEDVASYRKKLDGALRAHARYVIDKESL